MWTDYEGYGMGWHGWRGLGRHFLADSDTAGTGGGEVPER